MTSNFDASSTSKVWPSDHWEDDSSRALPFYSLVQIFLNSNRDFYQDVYTIFNRIKLTKWTICAFRVLNPHQWSLAKRYEKLKSNDQKVPKQAEAIRDGVINPQNYNFNKFKHGKFWCSSNATNQPKSTVELGYMCPRGLTGPPAVTLTK